MEKKMDGELGHNVLSQIDRAIKYLNLMENHNGEVSES